ncbi:Uncharacterized protein PBTT_00254 [Plasmodiophora brassicae]
MSTPAANSSRARAETFLDEANGQLEALYRAVFDLAHVNRTHSTAPIKSVMRRRLHSRVLSEMENETSLHRYDIEVTQRHVQVLTGRPREQLSLHLRLRGQQGIAASRHSRRDQRRHCGRPRTDRTAPPVRRRRPSDANLVGDEASLGNARSVPPTSFAPATGRCTSRRPADVARMQDQIVEKRDEIRAAETTMSASLNALAPMQAANDAEYAVFVRDWDTTAKLDERHRAVAPLGNLSLAPTFHVASYANTAFIVALMAVFAVAAVAQYPPYNTGGTYPTYNTGGTYPTYNTGGTYPTYNTGGTYPTATNNNNYNTAGGYSYPNANNIRGTVPPNYYSGVGRASIVMPALLAVIAAAWA